MKTESDKKPMRDKIIEAIKSGRVKMRPKRHFFFKAVLAAAGVIILALILLYLASFIVFVLRQTGILFVPVFGTAGWHAFLVSFPWFLTILLVIFIIFLEVLVRRYSFAYRSPVLYSIIGILFIIAIGGYVVDITHLHGRLYKDAKKNKLPFAGQFYREYGEQRLRNVHTGIITGLAESGFVIKKEQGDSLRVIITADTRFPFGTDFAENDAVVVFGERDDGVIHALGIRKIEDEFSSEFGARKPGARAPFGPPRFREFPRKTQ